VHQISWVVLVLYFDKTLIVFAIVGVRFGGVFFIQIHVETVCEFLEPGPVAANLCNACFALGVGFQDWGAPKLSSTKSATWAMTQTATT